MEPLTSLLMRALKCSYSVVAIEGDFLLNHFRYGSVLQPSSVNLEGGSSYVHLDDNIELNSPGVIPRVFPLVLDTQLLWLL